MKEARCAPTHDDIAMLAFDICKKETERLGIPMQPVSEELTLHNWLLAEQLLQNKWADECNAEDEQ
jgi:hypothetical protein